MTRMIRRNLPKTRRAASAAITTTAAGVVTYRTRRPLTEVAAVRFARMVAANPRFLDATVIRSRKANHFHVCFLPNSLDRIAVMHSKEDAKDVAAADRDGRRFLFLPVARPVTLTGYAGVYQCVGITGEYETTTANGGACSCPHFTYRRKESGGECKHIKELRRRQAAGFVADELPAPAPAPAPAPMAYGSAAFRARVSADFD